MSCDQNRINSIESLLKSYNNNISNNDLIYYLQCKSNNKTLDSNNLRKTEDYLKKINNSFIYENIFTNTSNYSAVVPMVIGCLLPFYYCYPRFYKLGFVGFSIGLISVLSLYSKINNLYSHFLTKIGTAFLGLSLIIYIVFFVIFNKLNHISLFFISAVVSYLVMNYIARLSLSVPLKSNLYNQYNATMNTNNPGDYTEYNDLLEAACKLIMDRYNLKLPSGRMLYSYLTVFEIGDNKNIYTDFFVNLFGPLISLYILWMLGGFFSIVKDESILNVAKEIDLFPIIGINNDSFKYFTCQANYVLPKELNVSLLIHELIDKYDFNNNIYPKIEKALLRISKELLLKYNPKFIKIDNEDKKIIADNLKNNKIYIEIQKLLKKNNIEFNIDYIDKIKEVIGIQEIPYKNKLEMYDLLIHINNTLIITNEVNDKYNNDSILAKDELLYDKDIPVEYKGLLKEITEKYIENFTNNLNLKDGTLFGYHYNIVSYGLFNNNTRIKSNELFKKLLRLLSTWLLLAKPVGSVWLMVKYILVPSSGFKKLLRNLSNPSIIWKYFSMGLDNSYFEDIYKDVKNNNQNTIITKGLNFMYSVFLFILLSPIIYFYNSTLFGFTINPSWYTFLYQVVFIINILGNITCYYSKKSNIIYNIYFLIGFIIVIILISMILYFIKQYKK